MQYNFNERIDRWDNYAVKYDEMEKNFGRKDLVSMWIADMDMKVAKPITDAIDRRNRQAIFGYNSKPFSYYEAIHDWQLKRNGWDYDINLTAHCPGIVPAIGTIVKEFSNPGDKVLFCAPVYSEFFSVVEDQGRTPLVVSLINNNGSYEMDWEKFAEAAAQKPAVFILCNPHNPCGRVWSKEDLKKMGEICIRNNILIFSDEIHSDLILYGNRHTNMAAVSDEISAITITGISATKTFNLAGLQACTVVFPNEEKKMVFEKFWMGLDIHRNNNFSLVAIEAAFREGEEWLEQLLAHLEGNIDYAYQFLKDHIPQITFHKPEATYLLWLDCRGLGLTGDGLKDFMINKAQLALNDGRSFGKTEGEGFMRMNIACPRDTVEKAMIQLKNALHSVG